MNRRPSPVAVQAKRARQAERAQRAAEDPWFGRRRRAGEMGRATDGQEWRYAACAWQTSSGWRGEAWQVH